MELPILYTNILNRNDTVNKFRIRDMNKQKGSKTGGGTDIS